MSASSTRGRLLPGPQGREHLLSLGTAIRETREDHGLSGRALAKAARVARWRVTALEEGQLDPDFELLLRLADAIGVPPATFVVRAEELGSSSS